MFSITITCPTTAKLVEVAKVLDDAGIEVGSIEGGETAPAKTTTKAADKPAAAKATTKAAPAKETKKAEGPTPEEKEALYAPVKAIALKLSKEKSRDVLLAVLGAFDVEKAPDLKVEQYDAFIEAAQNELDT